LPYVIIVIVMHTGKGNYSNPNMMPLGHPIHGQSSAYSNRNPMFMKSAVGRPSSSSYHKNARQHNNRGRNNNNNNNHNNNNDNEAAPIFRKAAVGTKSGSWAATVPNTTNNNTNNSTNTHSNRKRRSRWDQS